MVSTASQKLTFYFNQPLISIIMNYSFLTCFFAFACHFKDINI